MRTSIWTALVAALIIGSAQGGEARPGVGAGRERVREGRQVREDRKELGEDRADARKDEGDLRKDAREKREDAADARDDREDVRDDERKLAKDRKAGEDTSKDKQELKEDAKDLRKDSKDLKGDRQDVRKDRKDLREDTKEVRSDKRELVVDKRQENQARRIQNGIKNGSLTKEEAERLMLQQRGIERMEKTFEGDGKLSADEFARLRRGLNLASLSIWAEKHDDEGRTLPVYRLGRNVRVLPAVADKLHDGEIDRADARAFSKDFGRLLHLRRALAVDTLTDEQRGKMQAEYDDMLNKYFVIVDPK
jgi:hypothetical protein